MLESVIRLLQTLIEVPSFSREEENTASIIYSFLEEHQVQVEQLGNNIWAKNKYFDAAKPTILLNSHHDTVKPSAGYSRNPFEGSIESDKLYGLGSNDAGGALVGLIATFLYFYEALDLKYNLLFVASAEEEISGINGIALLLPVIEPIAFGIVGEPTLLNMAIAEKGLIVIDALASGKSGHAAREEGENAIYNALQDILWIQNYQFEKVSPLLGNIKMTVTQIQAGSQHNVIPDHCNFVIDVRTNEYYSNNEVFEIICQHTRSHLQARSFRLNSSSISLTHPLVQRGLELGLTYYGSPTLSDQALLPFPTLKIGPGDSARSHTADEFIYIKEIEQGISTYIALLEGLVL